MNNGMRAGLWRIYLATGTAAVAGYFLLPDDWWQTGAGAAIGLAAVAGLLVGVRLHRPRRPGLWWTLAAGLSCIAAGDLVYALYERVLHEAAPFPSLADAVYLAGCPLIGVSLVGLVRARTAGRDRVSWIDAAIVASGFGLLSWVFLLWSQALRRTDLLCRYGGEEFGVLLPGAATEQAAEVLERLRAVTPQGQTFSAGLAGWDGQEASGELVARADRALYAAKATGRNRVVVDHPEPAASHPQPGATATAG